ncbi:MAG TPA: Spx/MgsR family RNA polymerase-binding regulatory protein, partial [Polyangiaceae bacterium]|nr:Spx/MgsR family RNA polymerase-binding regulatory protein [Polyangiaceae bacterium]
PPAMYKLYHYPRCSTCRKARAWLDAHDVTVELIDIVENPPSREVLALVMRHADLPVAKLFNTSGELYRAGNYKERLKTMDKAEALAELAAQGKLIKRPLLVGDGVALVGFREAEYERALG